MCAVVRRERSGRVASVALTPADVEDDGRSASPSNGREGVPPPLAKNGRREQQVPADGGPASSPGTWHGFLLGPGPRTSARYSQTSFLLNLLQISKCHRNRFPG